MIERYEVTLESVTKVSIPIRVIANHEGSVITFTLIHQSEMSDAKFARTPSGLRKTCEN